MIKAAGNLITKKIRGIRSFIKLGGVGYLLKNHNPLKSFLSIKNILLLFEVSNPKKALRIYTTTYNES